MPKLRTTQVANAKPGKYYDGAGLALVVSKTSKKWVLRGTINGKRRDWGLGAFTDVGLADAREKAAVYRKLIRDGIDPSDERKRELALLNTMPTFRQVALMVHKEHSPTWRNAKDVKYWISTMERHVFPSLGEIPVDKISAPQVRDTLSKIWLEIPHTATKIKQRIGTVLDHAHICGWREQEAPLRSITKGLPKQPKRQKHFAAMPWAEVPNFIINMPEIISASITVRKAIEFTILTASRSGETRLATWDEIDIDTATWTRPEERMKAGIEHRVPLSDRAMEILGKPGEGLIFPGTKNGKPLSDMSLSMPLRRASLEITMHGFRSSFRDWCGEATGAPREVAEACLAHTIRNRTEAAYARSDLFDKRRALMDQWSSYCRSTANVKAQKVAK